MDGHQLGVMSKLSPISVALESSTVLIVDDEDDILDLLRYNLERLGVSVIAARNGVEALDIIENKEFDLIVLDIMMPQLNGIEVCQHIRKYSRQKTVPILFLTARSEEEDYVLGLEAGADSYLSKTYGIDVIMSQIKALLRGSYRIVPGASLFSIHDLEIDRDRYWVFRNTGDQRTQITFTRREFDLLYFLANSAGVVFTRKKLIKKVWGVKVEVGQRTVDVHVSKLNKKLGKYQDADYIQSVKGVGYRFLEPR